jgi:hypothetical protein
VFPPPASLSPLPSSLSLSPVAQHKDEDAAAAAANDDAIDDAIDATTTTSTTTTSARAHHIPQRHSLDII